MLGIIVAMGTEFRLVEGLLQNKEEKNTPGFRFLRGQIAGKEVVLMQCGIGKVCAAIGAVEMIRTYHPEYMLNTGVAGGIDSRLRVMDIVLGKEVVYHDVWCGEGNAYGQVQGMPERFCGNEYLLQTAQNVKSDIQICKGLICSGDRFITDQVALTKIKNNFPDGLAVDMESGAIAQVCHIYGVPFLSCRIISDTPGMIQNHALQYKDFWTAAPEKSFEVLRQVIEKI